MMTTFWKKKVILFLIAAFLSACSPATPPAPPAELPSALIFPRTVGINVDKIRSEEGSQAAFVAPGGEFSEAIASGADTAQALNDVVDEILNLFDQMEITIGTSTTTFETDFTDTFGDEEVSYNVKIDFADYDFDGNGLDEGCSGHTASTPICFRLWVDEERMMAGVFDEYPTEENPGRGEIRMGIGSMPGEITGEDLLIGIVYNHSDEEDKATDFFAAGLTTGLGVEGIDPFISAHIAVDQEGPDTSAQKTINLNAESGDSLWTTAVVEYLGRWLEDDDYWSGSALALSDEAIGSFEAACAQISTGEEVDRDLCQGLGIDVGSLNFTDLPTLGDIILPDDFPESPTF